MDMVNAIKFLEQQILDSTVGLPDEIFRFISKITPMVNVDLLIKDEKGRTLLSWRDDTIHGKGWHIPGGIIRFKETMEDRVREVAQLEIGTTVKFAPIPIAINQIISSDRNERGHFISILYKCFLHSSFVPNNKGLSKGEVGYIMWHNTCPENLIKAHKIYRKYI